MAIVLVTGGCGFIGGHIVQLLLDQGHRVMVLDDLSTGSLDNVPTTNPNFCFVNGSVLDKDLVLDVSENCELVFHLASLVGMKLVCSQSQLCYDVSNVGTANILSTDTIIPVVLFSSSAIYGLDNKAINCENAVVTLDEALEYDGGKPGYAAGKWELERQGKEAIEQGRQIMIVRPFNVIGTGQSSAYGMVLPNFIRNSIAGKPLVIYDDGEQTRSFTCVQKFVQCLYNLVQNPKAWLPPNNILNIGSDHIICINELAKLVLVKTKSNSPIEYVAYDSVFPHKFDVRYRNPDTTRFANLSGNIAWPSIPEIISKIADHYQELG